MKTKEVRNNSENIQARIIILTHMIRVMIRNIYLKFEVETMELDLLKR
jgi:hypothetical protein